jgi:hypothetical protein
MSILEESSFLQVVQGKVAKKIILRQGRKRFGPPDDATAATLEAIWDVERLERMSERLLDANSWAEVLATP